VLHRLGTLAGGRADLVALGAAAGTALAARAVTVAVRHDRPSVAPRGYPVLVAE